MNWIDLAQDRDRRRAFVKAGMSLRVPYSAGNFLTEGLLASPERICSMELEMVVQLLLAVTGKLFHTIPHNVSSQNA